MKIMSHSDDIIKLYDYIVQHNTGYFAHTLEVSAQQKCLVKNGF